MIALRRDAALAALGIRPLLTIGIRLKTQGQKMQRRIDIARYGSLLDRLNSFGNFASFLYIQHVYYCAARLRNDT